MVNKILIAILFILLVIGVWYIPSVNEGVYETYRAEIHERESLAQELLALNDTDFTVGATDPKLRIVIYTDTDCPFCKKMEPRFDRLLETYSDEVAITYRHYDVPSFPNSTYEHVALECVGMIEGAERYRDFQNNYLLINKFEGTGDFSKMAHMLAELYLPKEKADELAACMTNPEVNDRIERKHASGQTLGVRLTPTLIYVDQAGNYKLQSGSLSYDHLIGALNSFLGSDNKLGR